MSLPILTILRGASPQQVEAAIRFTANNLHAPEGCIEPEVAVAYVARHFRAGRLEGWDGFIEDLGV
jgi:hypothetical protein